MKDDNIIIHTDGGARGNPGPAASAFVAIRNGEILQSEAIFLGNSTNNIAEYMGVLLALKWLEKNAQTLQTQITFLLDSELVVKQINGAYKIKNLRLKDLFLEIIKIIKSLNKKIDFKHIPREENKTADQLVNKTLDTKLNRPS